MYLSISKKNIKETIELPASKSESNRTLLIEALAQFQGVEVQNTQLSNISEARDTQTLQRLLASKDKTLDVLDAGTTMRFLTAFCTVTNRETILTGTPRMKERPIHILVEALMDLGAEIEYLEKRGFPPIHIKHFKQTKKQIEVESNISSQYISALLMIAPVLEQGLEITLKNAVASKPYIEMTLALMSHFGIHHIWNNHEIHIEPQKYQLQAYTIEADWSAASYWYSVVAISEKATIFLPHLKETSLQGDKAIVEIMKNFGVETKFEKDGILITKTENSVENNQSYDFTHCPDLAQTIVALCVAKNISFLAKGVESLKIKETNRLLALKNEVAKFGFDFQEQTDGSWLLRKVKEVQNIDNTQINTYEDHRMAMAFAPLAMLYLLEIEQADEVVKKSYPHFWKEIQKLS
ncbi:3-phosphoshikimate 1-carboxyvinyltransferase [bacterium 336/3]|nr:3-phosphoshikimate 1-carboxyvinyltransferase [bacterium 336/3]